MSVNRAFISAFFGNMGNMACFFLFKLTKKISNKRFKLYIPCGYKFDLWHTIVHDLTLALFLWFLSLFFQD
jgi:hypothetical protein